MSVSLNVLLRGIRGTHTRQRRDIIAADPLHFQGDPLHHYQYAPSTSGTTLRKHIIKYHREDYVKVCQQNGWPRYLLAYINPPGPSDPGLEVAVQAFTPTRFIAKLVRFIAVDDQVSPR